MTEHQESFEERFKRANIKIEGNSPVQLSAMIEKRDQLLLPFLEALDRNEQNHARYWARLINLQGGRLKPVTVITPIAAHQESPETVFNALAQYAGQRDCAPFSIVLGLNTPTSEANNLNIAAVTSAIEAAGETFPALDIRVVREQYDEPIIGRIRRDLWNAVAWQSYEQTANGRLTETIGINHDIDLIKMSPHFIRAVQSFYARTVERSAYWGPFWEDEVLPPIWTPGKHAYDPRFPNISRAVMYTDTMHHLSRGGYEAGSVYPISFYANSGGFDPEARTHELHGLLRPNQRPDYLHSDMDGQWNIYSETIMRRFTARLQDNPFDRVWTTDSFGANDECRVDTPATDISRDRLRELIEDSLSNDMNYHIFGGAELYNTPSSVSAYEKKAHHVRHVANQRLKLASRVLRSVVGMPDLADAILEHYSSMPALLEDRMITNGKMQGIMNLFMIPPSE